MPALGLAAVAVGPGLLSASQVEGVLEAERHALGVGPLQLLIAQARARLVQAVPAVACQGFLLLMAGPVLKGLRGAVERSRPVGRLPAMALQPVRGTSGLAEPGH